MCSACRERRERRWRVPGDQAGCNWRGCIAPGHCCAWPKPRSRVTMLSALPLPLGHNDWLYPYDRPSLPQVSDAPAGSRLQAPGPGGKGEEKLKPPPMSTGALTRQTWPQRLTWPATWESGECYSPQKGGARTVLPRLHPCQGLQAHGAPSLHSMQSGSLPRTSAS